MRELKLVIWDLDETIMRGVFAEGDREVDPTAQALLQQLHDRGVLQAMATQNEPQVMDEAISHFGWSDFFQSAKADFAPKRNKVLNILDELQMSADHSVFVDNDPFHRDVMQIQVPDLTAWSAAELRAHVDSLQVSVTAEARRRPQMYRAMRRQKTDEQIAEDYEAFLAQCDIHVTIRPYDESDAERAIELLTRTNRMNLGGPHSPHEIVENVTGVDGPRLIVAELRDRYGDSGRCGLLRLTPTVDGRATIDSIAISCRIQARGLSLALLVGMLQHHAARFDEYRCLFHSTGRNRPLRMLLWAAGFIAVSESQELCAVRNALDAVALPSWVQIDYVPGAIEANGELSPTGKRS